MFMFVKCVNCVVAYIFLSVREPSTQLDIMQGTASCTSISVDM